MIDLTEIPSARGGAATQDLFELFARDFLEAIGFTCISGPDRGADDGRDLLVEEHLRGPVSVHSRRWLVSAKHYAHGGRAVGVEDETDIEGRVHHHRADGFIAFYSTVPSAGLGRRLESLHARIHCLVYDEGRIRSHLHEDPRLNAVFERYLPRSFRVIHGRQVDARIQFLSTLGFAADREGVPGPAIIVDGETGQVRFDDREIEAAMLAGFIFTQLRSGTYAVVEPFLSFDPVVWRYLRALLQGERGILRGIDKAIRSTKDAFFCRMLIIIAGHAEQRDALEAICIKVLNDGWPFHQHIRESQATVTPFFEVAQRVLARLAPGQHEILERYASKARTMERWHQYSLFKAAIAAHPPSAPPAGAALGAVHHAE
ncbi:MAG TPA: hypothetical protein VFJ16_06770 [Longimicrobium sp.]|nr:hypothetical protein [Longimicrobium sp.]